MLDSYNGIHTSTAYLYSHNDLPNAIRSYYMNQLDKVDLSKNGSGMEPYWQTDIPRLRAGKVGGQVKRLRVVIFGAGGKQGLI